MFKKVKNIFFLSFVCFFFIALFYYYFSEKNINKVNKNRTSYVLDLSISNKNLPLLKNDTNDIIEFRDDVEIYKKKKKKYKFFDLINK